jgi:hypothetical protein
MTFRCFDRTDIESSSLAGRCLISNPGSGSTPATLSEWGHNALHVGQQHRWLLTAIMCSRSQRVESLASFSRNENAPWFAVVQSKDAQESLSSSCVRAVPGSQMYAIGAYGAWSRLEDVAGCPGMPSSTPSSPPPATGIPSGTPYGVIDIIQQQDQQTAHHPILPLSSDDSPQWRLALPIHGIDALSRDGEVARIRTGERELV